MSIITSSDTLELEKLRKHKTIIYIILPKHKLNQYGVFINLFLSSVFEQLAQERGIHRTLPLLFLLDEFGNLGKINNFDGYTSTLRDYRISLNVYVQSVSQIYDLYGHHAGKTILDNLSSKLYFGGLGHETCEMVSRQFGYTTRQAIVTQGENQQPRTMIVKEPLMTPDTIRMLGREEALLISGNNRPIHFKTLPGYWKDKEFRKYASFPTHEPEFEYGESEVRRVRLGN